MFTQPVAQLQLHRLTRVDFKRQTDRWRIFDEFVKQNERMYPAIGSWLHDKVGPQLDTPYRRAFLLSSDDQPLASVVLKRSNSSKLCHVRVEPSSQDKSLGTLLFWLLAQEVSAVAKEVHFTLPESLWFERREFFKSFGFSESHVANQQYRLFERELSCSAPFHQFRRSAQDQLPVLKRFLSNKIYVDVPKLLMSMKPTFARAVIAREKQVEIRRAFSSRWIGERVCIYSSSPDRSLLGEATVLDVVPGNPEELWSRFGPEICCERAEFDFYAGNTSGLVAIRLGEIVKYDRAIPLSDIRDMAGNQFWPPQSYRTISEEDNFHSVLSAAYQESDAMEMHLHR